MNVRASISVALAITVIASISPRNTASAQISLTPYGSGLGFQLSTWGTGFTPLGAIGPLGIVPLGNGKVLVTDFNGNLRLFPYDTPLIPGGSMPTQTQSGGVLLANFGSHNAGGLGVLIGNPDKYYMTQQSLGRVVEINPNTGLATVIATGISGATGICAFPPKASYPGAAAHLGHLFVSSFSIPGVFEVDPATGATVQVLPTYVDGILFTRSGQYLMGANGSGFQVFDMLPTPHLAYNVPIAQGDGIAVGAGVALAGKAYVNTNDGKVWEVVYDTNPNNSLELEPPGSPILNLVASGGSRGDFIAVDTRILCAGGTHRFPSLLITQSSSIVRIDPPDSGWFGPPYSVEVDIQTNQSFCSGDGTLATPCPCSNVGLAGHGCNNSGGTGGAILSVTGSTEPDTMVLVSTGELTSAMSIFFQGPRNAAGGVVFGDGVRCADGVLKRMAAKTAVNGQVFYPDLSDPSIRALSSALGDTIPAGSSRYYQVYYRDPVIGFCGGASNTFNASNAIRIDW